MKKALIPLVFTLSGCAMSPQQYDLTTTSAYPPIQSTKNIPEIKLKNIDYQPPIGISPNTISSTGCLPCHADGSTPGLLFAEKISDIVKAEINNALTEVELSSQKSPCTLNAIIHSAKFNVMTGNTNVDITYTLSNKEQDIFKKRIDGFHDQSLFSLPKVNRMLAFASRDSVTQLVTNNDFLNIVNSQCK
ncbi:TPA: hypothetical protein ACX6Q5_000865 [Photobacterium damselae]